MSNKNKRFRKYLNSKWIKKVFSLLKKGDVKIVITKKEYEDSKTILYGELKNKIIDAHKIPISENISNKDIDSLHDFFNTHYHLR